MKPTFTLLSLVLAAASAKAAVSVDFESGPSQLRSGANGGNYSNTSNSGADDFLNFTQPVGSPSTVYYDANGNAPDYSVFSVSIGNPLTVSASVMLPTVNGSFGIFFGSPASVTGNSYLALFNLDGSGGPLAGDDQFRFDNAFNASTGGVGPLGAGLIGGVSNQFANAGVSTNAEFSISATYSILSATSFSIALTAGSVTSTRTFTGVTPLTSVEVGFRTNPISSTGTLDDIAINRDPVTVPEPSAFVTALVGAAGLLSMRHRQRR